MGGVLADSGANRPLGVADRRLATASSPVSEFLHAIGGYTHDEIEQLRQRRRGSCASGAPHGAS